MKQNIESMIGLATARGSNGEKPTSPQAAVKVKQKTFHEQELARKSDQQKAYYDSTVSLGKGRAQAFIDSATNTKDPQHAENFKVFKNLYGLDQKKAEADFIDQACAEFNEYEPEMHDPSYEARVLARYKPTGAATSVVIMKLYDNFVNDIKSKWDKSGYRGDAKWAKEYTDRYGLVPNSHIQDGFELKK